MPQSVDRRAIRQIRSNLENKTIKVVINKQGMTGSRELPSVFGHLDDRELIVKPAL